MNKMELNGKNIDKYIQYDIINDSDTYRNAILNNTQIIFDVLDNLKDFLIPIIDIIKIIKSQDKSTKINSFLEAMPNFDYKGLLSICEKIHQSIKDTKIDIKENNNLSYLVKSTIPNCTDEEIDNICKELIEYGIINKNGQFNINYIEIRGFKQSFELTIDDKYMKYEFQSKDTKLISSELKNKLNFIALKVSETALNNKKNEIKDEIYNQLENFMESIIEQILAFLEDKISEKMENLWNEYKKKKEMKE